jgi:cellulose synthase/poly-beta-1,6-N-acetylglucosamine synthase-like glycosyltransferase
LEIIVVSDASTDDTVSEIEAVNDPRIKLIKNPTRQGMAFSDNEILKIYKGDYLIILNADILPGNELLLESLTQPLIDNPKVGIVSCRIKPLSPKTFFEKVIARSEEYKTVMYEEFKGGNNIYLCYGRARAFSKEFLKGFAWPGAVGEDSYSFLSCITKGLEFKYQPNTEILFRVPSSFADYASQSSRYIATKNYLPSHFDPDLVKESYRIPFVSLVKFIVNFFIHDPVRCSVYVMAYTFCRLFEPKNSNSNMIWELAVTTKKLN